MTSGAPPAATSESGRCPFCAIVAGLEPASVVFADDHFVAFMDCRPVSEGHVIIATREHAHYLDEMAPAVGSALYDQIHLIRHALHSVGLADNDVRLFVSDGEPDYATIAHVFPGRRDAAPARHDARSETPAASRSHLDATAAELSRTLRDGASEPIPVGPPIPGHSAVFFSPASPIESPGMKTTAGAAPSTMLDTNVFGYSSRTL